MASVIQVYIDGATIKPKSLLFVQIMDESYLERFRTLSDVKISTGTERVYLSGLSISKLTDEFHKKIDEPNRFRRIDQRYLLQDGEKIRGYTYSFRGDFYDDLIRLIPQELEVEARQ